MLFDPNCGICGPGPNSPTVLKQPHLVDRASSYNQVAFRLHWQSTNTTLFGHLLQRRTSVLDTARSGRCVYKHSFQSRGFCPSTRSSVHSQITGFPTTADRCSAFSMILPKAQPCGISNQKVQVLGSMATQRVVQSYSQNPRLLANGLRHRSRRRIWIDCQPLPNLD